MLVLDALYNNLLKGPCHWSWRWRIGRAACLVGLRTSSDILIAAQSFENCSHEFCSLPTSSSFATNLFFKRHFSMHWSITTCPMNPICLFSDCCNKFFLSLIILYKHNKTQNKSFQLSDRPWRFFPLITNFYVFYPASGFGNNIPEDHEGK